MLIRTDVGGLYLEARTPELLALARAEVFDIVEGRRVPTFKLENPYQAALVVNRGSPTKGDMSFIRPILEDLKASWRETCSFRPSVPADREMMDFQRQGVAYVLERLNRGQDGCIVGDEMGLGKTCQAIAVANEMRAKRTIVVCPAAVRLQWGRELRLWSTIPRMLEHSVKSRASGVNPAAHFVTVSYDLIRNLGVLAALRAFKPDLVILDEAHNVKNLEALRSRAVFGGGEKAYKDGGVIQPGAFTVALTGTPLPNRPREAYNLARHLHWEAIDYASQDSFVSRYNPSATIRRGDDVVAVDERKARLGELGTRLRANLMVRRHKRHVLSQLPAVRYELVYAEQTAAVRKALAAEKLVELEGHRFGGFELGEGESISTVRRLMGEAMAPHAIAHVKVFLEGSEEKLAVFFHHRDVGRLLLEGLAAYNPAVISGGVSAVRRQGAVEQFQTDPTCRVFLGQMGSAGTGVDGLQKVCSQALITEPDWVPGNNAQTGDRLHRYGQLNAVTVQLLVVEGSISERICATMIGKASAIYDTIDR